MDRELADPLALEVLEGKLKPGDAVNGAAGTKGLQFPHAPDGLRRALPAASEPADGEPVERPRRE